MKVFLFAALFSLNTFASSGGELMALCNGTIMGNETKLNVYLDTSVFCESTYSGPYKGYVYIEGDGTSNVYEAAINYRPGKYSAVAKVGPNVKLKVLFPKFNTSEIVRATVNIEYEGDHSSSSVICDLFEYNLNCNN